MSQNSQQNSEQVLGQILGQKPGLLNRPPDLGMLRGEHGGRPHACQRRREIHPLSRMTDFLSNDFCTKIN